MSDNQEPLTIQELTGILGVLSKRMSVVEDSFNEIKTVQKSQEKNIDKQTILLEDIKESFSNGSTSDNSNTGGSGISAETLELKLKEMLLEDEELLELFTKVVENISTFNYNKDKVNVHIEKNRSVNKKNKKPLFVLISLIVAASLTVGYYFFSEKKNIIVPANVEFFELNKKGALQIPSDVNVKVYDEDNQRYYFKYNDKKYYVSKGSVE